MNIRLTTEPTALEAARLDALTVLSGFDPVLNKDEFEITMKHVETLSKLIAAEQREKLSPNAVLTVLGNIFVALKVVNYEETNIVTTKVLPFLLKRL